MSKLFLLFTIFFLGCYSAAETTSTKPCQPEHLLPQNDKSFGCLQMEDCLCNGVCAGPATEYRTDSCGNVGTYCEDNIESTDLLLCAFSPTPNGCNEEVQKCQYGK